jgi:[acyl-carrier-protein] S-malonyltransferase
MFKALLQEAAETIDPGLIYFDPVNNDFLGHELRTQYIAYIYGCAYSRVLNQHNITPSLICGYSMGIYAALSEGGAISFVNGLELIKMAFQEISYTTMTGRFGMGGIIGLSENDIRALIKPFQDLEISNQNSPYSFVLSGKQQDLEQVLAQAKEEGAFHARMLQVTVPYHAHLLKAAAIRFAQFVYSLNIHTLQTPLISVLSQREIRSPEDIKTELVDNLYKHFNWYQTQKRMMALGIRHFVECGPGKNLKKNARFIDGDFRFLSIQEITNP